MGMRWQPSLQVIPHYESEPTYIDALIKSVKEKLGSISWKPDLIILIAPTLFCCPNILIFRLLSFKKVLTMLQIQDFELEAAFNLGILKGKIFKTLFTKLELIFFRSFQVVGTISRAMEKKVA